MKHVVSSDTRTKVIELRRKHTLNEVAKLMGMPIGTVKTICSRSGSFRDNPAHRAMFSLPPIHESKETLPTVPELPPKHNVTGDAEIDAVMWLRSVISTGHASLIDKAMEAAQAIKTPLKVVEKRYMNYLVSKHPNNPMNAALGSFGFADLSGLAEESVEKAARCHEARARFGDEIFADSAGCVGVSFSDSRTVFVSEPLGGGKIRGGKFSVVAAEIITEDGRIAACLIVVPTQYLTCN